MRRRLHHARLALADALLVFWALIYWNARKTRFRQRGGRCPCQSPSDSGRGGETRCEAAQTLHAPGRFRVACPLLARTPGGWMCSADTARVRPFWGRAAGLLATLALAGWLGLSAAAWGATLALGWRGASPLDFAWPGRWETLRATQADHFRRQALAAFARDDFAPALLALATAYTKHPQLDDGLLLATLHARAGSHASGDRLFEDLLARFPAQRARILWALHDSLLVAGRADTLAALALNELARDTTARPEWRRALVFAAGRVQSPAALARRLDAGPAELRALAGAAGLRREGRDDEAAARLRAFTPQAADEAALLVGLWLDWGQPDEAAAAFQRHRARLDPFDVELLAYAINLAGARPAATAGYRDRALAYPLTPARLDALCARLVAAPDAALAAAFGRKILESSAPAPEALAAGWLAATLHGDTPAATVFASRLAAATGFTPPPLPAEWDLPTLGRVTLALPLPRHTVRALATRVPPSAVANAAR
jgi:hypothetical protein